MSGTTKKAFIKRNFTDAGTSERFVAGTVRDLSAGAFANHKAAGLVRDATAAEAKAAAGPDPKANPTA
jgi:hypothetical protein